MCQVGGRGALFGGLSPPWRRDCADVILISGEPVIYFGSRRATFAFESKNVGNRRVARHLLRKTSNHV